MNRYKVAKPFNSELRRFKIDDELVNPNPVELRPYSVASLKDHGFLIEAAEAAVQPEVTVADEVVEQPAESAPAS
jgi:hypothetical protein